eukprot:TRINITY_DN96933_c0_g1_i1.p1 TRINITY_DN96933_c0_g1~~TRINITY_DN96933_c0_g1_i1.p1  ORF type:complete len:213 (-),score=32.47 TRINITY_DN96933_c0_g1_i1:71-709(-)
MAGYGISSSSSSALDAVAGKRRVVDSEGPVLELLQSFGIRNGKGYYDSRIRGKVLRFDHQKLPPPPPPRPDNQRGGGGRHKEAQGKEHWKNLRYEDFEALRTLWTTYITELRPGEGEDLCETLASVDLHGSTLQVVQAKNPGCVNLKGTVIEETQRTFRIITSDSRVRMLPKEACVFEVEVLGHRVRLLGPAWKHRLPGGAPGPLTPQGWAL